jgi:hypothetical protein
VKALAVDEGRGRIEDGDSCVLLHGRD